MIKMNSENKIDQIKKEMLELELAQHAKKYELYQIQIEQLVQKDPKELSFLDRINLNKKINERRNYLRNYTSITETIMMNYITSGLNRTTNEFCQTLDQITRLKP